MLTEAGLSTIVTAIIGARKIFQRMNTYAKCEALALTAQLVLPHPCHTLARLSSTCYDLQHASQRIMLLR